MNRELSPLCAVECWEGKTLRPGDTEKSACIEAAVRSAFSRVNPCRVAKDLQRCEQINGLHCACRQLCHAVEWHAIASRA